nr:reverse transcriptase domain-containing protein [Tanacetum cinerariifolium]
KKCLDRLSEKESRSVPAGVIRSVPARVTRSVHAGVTRSVSAGVTRSVPARFTRSVPAGVIRSVPAGVTRSVPAGVTRLKFIDWQYFLDYDSEMMEMLFAEYTGIKVKNFRETLLLYMGNVKKSIAERTRHKRHWTKSDEHITSNSLGTCITHALDAYIRPVNDQVPSAEVHLTAQHNFLANEQQHTDQSKPSYDTYLLEKVDRNTTPDSTNMCHRGGEIDQDAEQDQVKIPLLKTEFLKTNVMVEKEVYNELSNRFLQLEKHCISLEISMQQMKESFQSNKQSYENSLIYKEKTKRIRDSKIKDRVFTVGERVLLFNSRLKIFSGKLKTHWSGPFTITQVFPYGTVELSQTDGPNFKWTVTDSNTILERTYQRWLSRISKTSPSTNEFGDWVKLSDPKQALHGRQPVLILVVVMNKCCCVEARLFHFSCFVVLIIQEFSDFEGSCSRFCPSITRSLHPQLHFRN